MLEFLHELNEDDKQANNLAIAKSIFEGKYNSKPQFYVRVPGRVNLIGEHIDYCGYAVFPMAIEQDIILAVAPNSDKKLNLTNLNPTYEDHSTDIENLEIDRSDPKWFHYFYCGVKGIAGKKSPIVGIDVAVHGTVPPSAGLSSSSALVCGATLVAAFSNNLDFTKLEIASLSAVSEKYIGTEGGGMDQAIAILAEPGSAKLIEFNPLKATNVSLPDGATFVIANSCVEMNKAASSHYNIRVVECRLAAQIIAKSKELNWKTFRTLGSVQIALDIPLSEMSTIVSKILHSEPYTKEEICQILEISDEELTNLSFSENTKSLLDFKLFQRAKHVYEEAERVWKFKSICESGSTSALLQLGDLMNASHESCRDLYECSHPELDELVKVSIKAGALGSRLTGAGWGGCCVSLVPNGIVDKFIATVKENFFLLTQRRKKMVHTGIFPTLPGGGAAIYTLEN